MCFDLKPLNESALREVHLIPKVNEILAQLAGATVFSKLDANSGFWQIPLDEESRLLTKFIIVLTNCLLAAQALLNSFKDV